MFDDFVIYSSDTYSVLHSVSRCCELKPANWETNFVVEIHCTKILRHAFSLLPKIIPWLLGKAFTAYSMFVWSIKQSSPPRRYAEGGFACLLRQIITEDGMAIHQWDAFCLRCLFSVTTVAAQLPTHSTAPTAIMANTRTLHQGITSTNSDPGRIPFIRLDCAVMYSTRWADSRIICASPP